MLRLSLQCVRCCASALCISSCRCFYLVVRLEGHVLSSGFIWVNCPQFWPSHKVNGG